MKHERGEHALTPEQAVILAAARVPRVAGEGLRDQLEQRLDWAALIEISLAQGVLPLVYTRLRCVASDLVPAQEMGRLRSLYATNARRNLRLTRRLLQVLDLLAREGIEAVPLKGPVLAVQVFGDLCLRQFTDLDILIRPGDLPGAHRALTAAGYSCDVPLTARLAARLTGSGRELGFGNRCEYLEVQWAIAERFLAIRSSVDELWRTLQPIDLSGKPVRTLSPENTLVVLCVHGATHAWECLKWIVDVAHLVDSHPALNWDDVLAQARQYGIVRIVHLGLRLAMELGGARVPRDLMNVVQQDAAAGALAEQVRAHLWSGAGGGGLAAFTRFFLSSRERLVDRVGYCLDLTLAPKLGDWLMFDLPAALSPLYYFSRPVRLITAACRRAW